MDQEQFKKEVVPLRNKLEIYARHLLNNPQDVEDVVQEVFLKMWFIRNQLDKYNDVGALAMQINKNLCINHLRTPHLFGDEAVEDSIEKIDDKEDPYVKLEHKDAANQVIHLMDRLPELQQKILKMKHVEGFEVEEIAELTGGNVEAVRVNLSRARKKIRELYLKFYK